jgi:hypothetical protein
MDTAKHMALSVIGMQIVDFEDHAATSAPR